MTCFISRETAKRRPGYHRDIYYRSPCSKRLVSIRCVTTWLFCKEEMGACVYIGVNCSCCSFGFLVLDCWGILGVSFLSIRYFHPIMAYKTFCIYFVGGA